MAKLANATHAAGANLLARRARSDARELDASIALVRVGDTMPLSLQQLEDIQADCMADDLAIDLATMSLWTEAQATAFFESGGTLKPGAPAAPAASRAWTAGGDRPTGATPWLRCLKANPAATHRLVVFSWTGNRGGQGSAHNLSRTPCSWAATLPSFEVSEIVLPGRGTRLKEPLVTSAARLVAALAAAVGPALEGGKPYAFVGFSFGAVLAWETALAIAASHAGEGPAVLLAVSAEGPAWERRRGEQHALDEASFEAMLQRKGGTDFILKDAGLKKAYLPVIRADLQLEETYRPADGRLAVPVIALFGHNPGRDKERSRVSRDAAEGWLAATERQSTSRLVGLDACDWYVLQDEAGVQAVQAELKTFMAGLAG